MSVGVGVDLGSAAISYRPAAGKERSLAIARVSLAALFEAVPWRAFRWYFGQLHYSGTWWSATMRDHVIYESRLERSRLLLADFDPAVLRIVAQPFMLTATVNGASRRHIPDYLWDTVDGPVVVDVVRAERLSHADIDLVCRWTREVVESLGWEYRVLTEPAAVRLGNVSFLAGYRRDWLINVEALREIRSCRADLAGLSIASVEGQFTARPQPLVRAALMHLLWRQEFRVDLDEPLRPSTVLEVTK